jgi:hypothetical protein
LQRNSIHERQPMRKLILMALATYVWKRVQARLARPATPRVWRPPAR